MYLVLCHWGLWGRLAIFHIVPVQQPIPSIQIVIPTDEMKPQSTPSLHILRGLLRQLRPTGGGTVGSPGASAVARKYVVAQYRVTQSTPGLEKAEELQALAFEYFTLRRDIAERSKLHQLDTGAEEQLSPKELSRRAAARAGLQLPKLNPDL